MKNNFKNLLFYVFIFTAILTSCGGGSASKGTINRPNTIKFSINTNSNYNVMENNSLTSSPPQLNGDSPVGTLTWSLSGRDITQFTIDSTSGVFVFSPKDFEQPLDDDKNNSYLITLNVKDSENNRASTPITITVTNSTNHTIGTEQVIAPTRDKAGITSFGDTVHVIYESNSVIYYRRSINEGLSWSPDISVNGRELVSGATAYLIDPLINDGTNLYLFYVRVNENISDFLMPLIGASRPVGDIYVKISRDNGDTWESEIRLTTNAKAFRLSSTASSAGKIHLVWMDFVPGNFEPLGDYGTWNINYINTSDSFTSHSEVVLYEGISNFGKERPSIKAKGDNLYLTWMQERQNLLSCVITAAGISVPSCPGTSFSSSSDAGMNWTNPVNLSPTGTFYTSRPTLGVTTNFENNEDVLSVAYDEFIDVSGNLGLDIRAVTSLDSGLSWSTDNVARLSNLDGDSTHGHVNGSESTIQVAWHDVKSTGGTEILWSTLDYPYQNWKAPKVISSSTGDTPLVASSLNFYHVIWLGTNSTQYVRITKD